MRLKNFQTLISQTYSIKSLIMTSLHKCSFISHNKSNGIVQAITTFCWPFLVILGVHRQGHSCIPILEELFPCRTLSFTHHYDNISWLFFFFTSFCLISILHLFFLIMQAALCFFKTGSR